MFDLFPQLFPNTYSDNSADEDVKERLVKRGSAAGISLF
jgi:hypothetical protein